MISDPVPPLIFSIEVKLMPSAFPLLDPVILYVVALFGPAMISDPVPPLMYSIEVKLMPSAFPLLVPVILYVVALFGPVSVSVPPPPFSVPDRLAAADRLNVSPDDPPVTFSIELKLMPSAFPLLDPVILYVVALFGPAMISDPVPPLIFSIEVKLMPSASPLLVPVILYEEALLGPVSVSVPVPPLKLLFQFR